MTDDTFNGKPWEDLDTNPTGDRAETRAREWLAPVASLDQVHSLAAQFREERQHTLAEVRRVVEGETGMMSCGCASRILARLEKL